MRRPYGLVIAIVLLGVAGWAGTARSGGAPATSTTALEKARSEAAAKAYDLHEKLYSAGTGSLEDVYLWSRRWCEAEGGPKNAAAADVHYKRMVVLDAVVKVKANMGAATQADVAAAAFYRAEAELWKVQAP